MLHKLLVRRVIYYNNIIDRDEIIAIFVMPIIPHEVIISSRMFVRAILYKNKTHTF